MILEIEIEELQVLSTTVLANLEKGAKKRSAAQIADDYVELKEAADAIKLVMTEINKVKTKMAQEVLPTIFEDQGFKSITTQSGRRVTITSNVRANILKENRDAAYDWLRNNGLEDIVINTVNASTLSATARTLIEDGKQLDDELFNVQIIPNTSVTKVK
jgi:hypothetical protein